MVGKALIPQATVFLYCVLCSSLVLGLESKHTNETLTDVNSCDVIPSASSYQGATGLSHFWAQELVGADLVNDILKLSSITNVDVAVLEDMERDHAAKVSHLVSSVPHSALEPSVSIANPLRVQALAGGFNPPPPSAKKISGIFPFTENLPQLSPNLRVINISRPLPTTHSEGYLRRSEFLEKRFSELSNLNNGIAIVTSAGNQHLGGEEISPLKYNPHIIAVGNLSPSGLVHATSDSGAHVFALAPAGGDYQLSQNVSGAYEGFGGTSGATPMVSSLIGLLYSINPNFNNDIIKKIISITVQPTLANIHDKNANGNGLINAPKAIVLAQRITEHCQKLSQTDLNKCYLSNLNDLSLTDEASSNNLKGSIVTSKQIWPSCDDEGRMKTTNLESEKFSPCIKAQMIKKLRLDILLENNDSVVKSQGLRMLACIYGLEGFSENSHLYEALALAANGHNGVSDKSKILDFTIGIFHKSLSRERKTPLLVAGI